jgi:hypothetical protein
MNIQKMMKEAQRLQQKMQEEMARAQEELAAEQLSGTSGGGLVTVTVTGHKALVSVKIDRSVVDPEDVEMLEDLVFAAMQAALGAADARAAEVMARVQSGMGLPPGLDLGGMFG